MGGVPEIYTIPPAVNGTTPGKNGCQFFGTLPHSNVSKREVGIALALLGDDFLVSQESHEDGTPHLHFVSITRDPYQYTEFAMVITEYGLGAPHIEGIKKLKDVVRYCCKEDIEPLYDGDRVKKCLPWHTNAGKWVRAHPTFNHYDAFVMSLPVATPALKRMHNDYWGDRGDVEGMVVSSALAYPWPPSGLRTWERDVKEWVEVSFVNNRVHKMPQLFLTGEPNVGKTTLMQRLLKFEFAYRAGVDRWWLMRFDPKKHLFIYIDEFDYDTFVCKKDLLKLLAGESFQFPVKFKTPGLYDSNLPVIVISNYAMPDDAAFRVRVIEVNADCPYF